MTAEDGWYTDPTSRHELRYWGGGEWSAAISDRNVLGSDPIDDARALAPPGGPSTAAQRERSSATMVAGAAAQPPFVAAPTAPTRAAPSAVASSTFAPALPPGAPGVLPAGVGTGPAPPPGAPIAQHGGPALAPPGAAGFTGPVPPPGAPGGFGAPITGRSGARLRTGAPGTLAVASMLYAGPALLLVAYGLLAFLLAAVFDSASDDVLQDTGSGFALVGVVVVVFGAAYAATSIGLAMVVPWARPAALLLLGVQVLGVLASLVQGAPEALLLLVYPVASALLVLAPSSGEAFSTRRINVAEIVGPKR